LDKKTDWVKIAESTDAIVFNGNNLAEVKAGDKTICAFAQKCPHAGGFFCEGWLDALGNVVCPLHRYKFSLKNGRNVSGEGYYLKHWPVEAREDGVYVGLEKSSFFGLF
jgi:nitrite reductase/ring-hydroxylating ferredoxin subunit